VGTTPIGAYVMGRLAEAVGVSAMVLIMAALCGVGVVAGAVYIRRTGTVDFVTTGEDPDEGLDLEDRPEPG